MQTLPFGPHKPCRRPGSNSAAAGIKNYSEGYVTKPVQSRDLTSTGPAGPRLRTHNAHCSVVKHLASFDMAMGAAMYRHGGSKVYL